MTRQKEQLTDKNGDKHPSPRSLLKDNSQPGSYVTDKKRELKIAIQQLNALKGEARADGHGTITWEAGKDRLTEELAEKKEVLRKLMESPADPATKKRAKKQTPRMDRKRKRSIENAKDEVVRAEQELKAHTRWEIAIFDAGEEVKDLKIELAQVQEANHYKNIMNRFATHKKKFPPKVMKPMVQKAADLLIQQYAIMGCVVIKATPHADVDDEEGDDEEDEAEESGSDEELESEEEDEEEIAEKGADTIGEEEEGADKEDVAPEDEGTAEGAVLEEDEDPRSDAERSRDFAKMTKWLESAAKKVRVHPLEVLELARKDFMRYIHEMPKWEVVGFNAKLGGSGKMIGYTVDWIPKCEWWEDPEWKHLKGFCTNELAIEPVEEKDAAFAAELEVAPETATVEDGTVCRVEVPVGAGDASDESE